MSGHDEPKRLYLTADDVSDLLEVDVAISLMRRTFADHSAGILEQLHRRELVPSRGGGALGMMPAFDGGPSSSYAAKVVCVVHRSTGGPSHHGLVLLFDGQTGDLMSTLDAGAVTASRTAAVTAVATDLLARTDSSRLGVLGAGHQVIPHLRALAEVRDLSDICIWARRSTAARAVAADARALGFPARAVIDPADAVRNRHIVVTLTPARAPIINRDWVSPGTHINAIGASTCNGWEVDPATVLASTVYVDDLTGARADAGDLLHACEHSTFDLDDIVGTIGEVLTGVRAGRTDPEQITLFKSVGLAVQDLASAQYLTARARAVGRGMLLPAAGATYHNASTIEGSDENGKPRYF